MADDAAATALAEQAERFAVAAVQAAVENKRENQPDLAWLQASRAYGRQVRSLRTRLRTLRFSRDIDTHPGSWADLDHGDRKGAYRKTFPFDGELIDANHRAIAAAPGGRLGVEVCVDLGIDGYLQRADALKIYEIARLGQGDVLEIGTHYGLSASIIASALATRGSGRLETVDFIDFTTADAKANLRGRPGEDRVTFTVIDGARRMRELAAEGLRFGYIFIDHWHGYQATYDAARELAGLLQPGGFVQFHDFVDSQNADPTHFYGVTQAVLDTVCKDGRFLFCGVYGCTGLFRFLGPSPG